HIEPAVLAAVAKAAGAPVILETPAEGIPDDLRYLRDAL
ncbi:deoxyribonuclease IV, partial [Streptomyces sp. SID10244]|nr:deoxyribonuclease IV [Streptomyces sp. SID10244]